MERDEVRKVILEATEMLRHLPEEKLENVLDQIELLELDSEKVDIAVAMLDDIAKTGYSLGLQDSEELEYDDWDIDGWDYLDEEDEYLDDYDILDEDEFIEEYDELS
ncbi:MAG: hypothetical protein DRJ35_08090 [Thermoprotei archaeon]|nr:MAG: hypothetical protein DRJ35_08090 [Thermoprotei archaeon]